METLTSQISTLNDIGVDSIEGALEELNNRKTHYPEKIHLIQNRNDRLYIVSVPMSSYRESLRSNLFSSFFFQKDDFLKSIF